MNATSIEKLVTELIRIHADDRDGGEGLIDALVSLYRSSGSYERELLARRLTERALAEETAWAVALDVLAEVSAIGSAAVLVERARTTTNEIWRRHALFALLRMGAHESLEESVRFIEDHLASRPDDIATMIPALASMDEDECVRLSCIYFVTWLQRQKNIKNVLPSYVHAMLRNDSGMGRRLVAAVSEVDCKKGAVLREMLIDALRKPWHLKKYGNEAIEKALQILKDDMSAN